MRRHATTEKVSREVIEFAAAAYDYHAELTSPAPDHVMRRIARERLDEARRALPVDDCVMLARLAGR